MKALTDAAHWDKQWWTSQRPRKLNWLYRDQDYETVRLIRAAAAEGTRIAEVGGGGSRLLPYLARKLGTPVFGTDFSLTGCRLLRANFELQGVEGQVVCEDLLQSSLAGGSFDIVYSAGVIEHFEDQPGVVAAHLRLVKPGGRLILTAPNLAGVQGRIFRRLAPPLWAKHLVLRPDGLAEVFRQLGLREVRSGFLGSFFLRVGRDSQWTGVQSWPAWLRTLAYWSVRLGNAAVSLLFRLLPWRPHTRAWSPSVFATGLKPQP
ncbi:MAG TPA: class I SAM-dependent methyltransferase [Terriglobia bacterium]|nr:class I SAM-dependent methyltransferase [Terriglobia bacterium]